MFCPHCGKTVDENAQYCQQCGRQIGAAQASLPTEVRNTAPAAGGFSVSPFKVGCGVLALVLVIVGFIGGIFGLIYYITVNSDANKLAQEVLHTHPAVREAIGEVQDIGIPIGSLKTSSGGTGNASLSMSVEGSKAEGKFYGTFVKENDVWRFTSGRIKLEGGGSVDILPVDAQQSAPPPQVAPDVTGTTEAPKLPTSAGKALKSDASLLKEWKTVEWPGENIGFRVPADWEQVQLTKKYVEFRSQDRKAYLTGSVAYFDQKIPFQNMWESFLQKGNGQLLRGEIKGYALKNLGKGEGYFEINSREDGQSSATWSGFVDTPQFGTKAVNFLFGAPTLQDFEDYEPILGAIYESIDVR